MDIVAYKNIVSDALESEEHMYRHEDGPTYLWHNGIVNFAFETGRILDVDYPNLIAYLDQYRRDHSLGTGKQFNPPDVPYQYSGQYYLMVQDPTQAQVSEVVHELEPQIRSVSQVSSSTPNRWFYASRLTTILNDRFFGGQADDKSIKLLLDLAEMPMQSLGWTFDSHSNLYESPLPINRSTRENMIREFNRDSFGIADFYTVVARDAFDKYYYCQESAYSDEFKEYVTSMADFFGYERKGNSFKLIPPELPENIEEIGFKILADTSLRKVSKVGHVVIPLDDVFMDALRNHGIRNLNIGFAKSLLFGRQGAWRKALIMSGFGIQVVRQNKHDYSGIDGYGSFEAFGMFRNAGTYQADPKIELATGFPVDLIGIAIDDSMGQLVYLEVVGAENAVGANWAALMQPKRSFSYKSQSFQVGSADNHRKFATTLPSGFVHMILAHKSASPALITTKTNVGYVVSDEGDNLPQEFFGHLNNLIEVPVLPEWSEYLWVVGRLTRMIEYAGNPNKQHGPTTWKIRTGSDQSNWADIISSAVAAKELAI